MIQTEDRVVIIGTFVSAPESKGAALLLHMMPSDRTSWMPFQGLLADRGVASLAIDLRGHGESTLQDGRRISYQDFKDADHQRSSEDVRASLRWLQTHGFPSERIVLAGASIGANLALVACSQDAQIRGALLLSPGANYRGVKTFEAAAALSPSQGLWAAASMGDDEDSFQETKQLVERCSTKQKTFTPLTASGHGTIMLDRRPDMAVKAVDWILSQFTS